MSNAMLSRPYDVDSLHHSIISSRTFLFTAYSGSDVIGRGSLGLWSITEHQNILPSWYMRYEA